MFIIIFFKIKWTYCLSDVPSINFLTSLSIRSSFALTDALSLSLSLSLFSSPVDTAPIDAALIDAASVDAASVDSVSLLQDLLAQ